MVVSGAGWGAADSKEGHMPTLYVTMSSMATWHILRPNERQLVWCRANPENPTWTRITLKAPASACAVCQAAESASLAADLDRIPALAGVF
jgi:hypothetical protein